MRPREILSANVRALMAARPALSTIKKIVDASNGQLSNGKVGRITAASHTTDVDTLEALAKVFDMESWQLLVPTMSVVTGPDGRSVVAGLPDWPFEMIERSRFDALTERQRGFVQARVVSAIEECEGTKPRLVAHPVAEPARKDPPMPAEFDAGLSRNTRATKRKA